MKTAAYKRILAWCAKVVCLVVILAGCGNMGVTAGGESGSGMIVAGVGTGGTGVVKSANGGVSAPSTDYSGAMVFLDINNNRLPDPDEPFAYTDQNGSYVLQTDAANLTVYPLLLQAIAGVTMEKATGRAVAEGFVTLLVQQ